jgi:hypothetical protein
VTRILFAIFLAATACVFALPASAAPIIAQDNYYAGTGWATDTGGIGQTFVWPAAVPLGIARVTAFEAPFTGTFKLYNGVHTCDNSGGEIFSQTNIPFALGVYTTIVLSAPQALAQGSTYTFCVYNVSGGRLALNYTSGTSYYPNGAYVSDTLVDPIGVGTDLQFELDAPLAPAQVPVLTPWWLGLLASFVLMAGVMASRRRNKP